MDVFEAMNTLNGMVEGVGEGEAIKALNVVRQCLQTQIWGSPPLAGSYKEIELPQHSHKLWQNLGRGDVGVDELLFRLLKVGEDWVQILQKVTGTATNAIYIELLGEAYGMVATSAATDAMLQRMERWAELHPELQPIFERAKGQPKDEIPF